MVHARRQNRKDAIRRVAGFVSVFALAFTVALALPVSPDSGFAVNGAHAAGKGNGNGGGNGKALGKSSAPGQQDEQVADSDEQGGVGGSGAGTMTGSGGDELAEETLPIADDASTKVVKELVGIPDDSELTEEEELEAIRSGWGTWRTADGPNSVTAQ